MRFSQTCETFGVLDKETALPEERAGGAGSFESSQKGISAGQKERGTGKIGNFKAGPGGHYNGPKKGLIALGKKPPVGVLLGVSLEMKKKHFQFGLYIREGVTHRDII